MIRMSAGYSGDFMQQKSRFLYELPKEMLDEWILKPANPWGNYTAGSGNISWDRTEQPSQKSEAEEPF